MSCLCPKGPLVQPNRNGSRHSLLLIPPPPLPQRKPQIHNSLDTWSPTINVNRDPRWGRNVESPGEDPFVCGSYGTAYAQGLQQYTGEEAVVQAVVTLKHWLAYSIENYRGVTRYNVDVEVSAGIA